MVDRLEAFAIDAPDECRSVKTIDAGVWRMADQVHRRRSQNKAWKMKAVKLVSIAVLLTTASLWMYAAEFQFLTRSLIALGALAVMFQSVNTKSYGFAVLFLAMALLYNPLVPLFPLSGPLSLVIVLGSAVPFATSLIWMKTTLAERDRISGTEGI